MSVENNLKFWEQHFKRMNRPSDWLQSACRLKHGAELLFEAYSSAALLADEERAGDEDFGLAGVATLLYGLAMENMMKAVLLHRGIAKVAETDGNVSWNVDGAKQHDLVSLSKQASLRTLESVELKLLERLSAFVCWAGKYPTPNFFTKNGRQDFQGLLLSDQPGCGKIMLPSEFAVQDTEFFDKIFHELSDIVSGRCRQAEK